jgi:glycosyltransferase involved in cell wall biosynthesis
MRIGIDARMYGPKWGGGGLGRYVEELVQHLQGVANATCSFLLFLKPENFDACAVQPAVSEQFQKQPIRAHWYTLKEQIVLPFAVRKARVDLMHYPHWNVPIFSRVPFVVTIHDLILLETPHSARVSTRSPILFFLKRLGFRLIIRHAIRNSQAIIAVSQSTKKSILEHFPRTPSSKIHVIYEGVTVRRPQGTFHGPNPIPPPYFLYVGSAYPHKNLETLLHAFSFFVKEHPMVKLVLIGMQDVFYARLKKEAREIDIPEGAVLFLGFVPEDILDNLYRGAHAYLYPSLIEGFGLPPLEAMLRHIPVAAARSSALLEILGQAALYFNPTDIEEIIQAMDRLFDDRPLRQSLIQKGGKQVKKYSWKKMAEQTLSLYEEHQTHSHSS